MVMTPRHIGIVACSAEGAALCYRTICIEGAAILGPHAHPEVTVHTPSLAAYMTSHEGSWCQASIAVPNQKLLPPPDWASPLVLFKLRSTAHRCRPVELWATHCVVQAQRQIHRVLPATYTVVARARFPIKIAALQ